MTRKIPQVVLAGGIAVPALGMGTWMMGERRRDRAREVEALRRGIDLGMTFIDTAEMYGDGAAERIVAEAIEGQRERVFLVSKVYPHNASRNGVTAACERSLKRLNTDHLDLYLLHWRGNIPLADTVAGFEALRREGRIGAWGVSNFDRDDIEELLALPDGSHCAANQVLYHLESRGIEWDLLAQCRECGIAPIAYSPLGQGRLLARRTLRAMAKRAGATPAQTALAWLLTQRGIVAIPKASDPAHVRENRAAVDLVLPANMLAELDRAFPPPQRSSPLAML